MQTAHTLRASIVQVVAHEHPFAASELAMCHTRPKAAPRHEADESGVRYVTRAWIDPRGIPTMFEKLLQERGSQPSAVAAWFSTHPLEEDRITDTRSMIDRIDPLILQSLTRDSDNFHAFKKRVQSLPPSPATKAQ